MYLQHRSLWYDEAALALNVVDRGFIGLLAPLSHLQVAPPLFLWAERMSVLAFGPNEWALRAVPLAAGLATPPVMWRWVRRVLPPPAAVLAVALVALSPALVRYAAEAKPYAVDAFVTLVLCERALACTSADATPRTWWLLGVLGAAGIALSTPAPFVLAGVVAYLAVRAAVARDGRYVKRIGALTVAWAGVFVILLVTTFQAASPASEIGRFMQWYWASSFLTPDPPGLRTKVSAMTWALLTNTFLGLAAPRGATTLLAAAVVAGLVALVARRNAMVALLVTPLVAALAASTLRRYPIAERLMLYVAPLTAVVLAAALLVVRRFGDRPFAWLGGAAIVGVGVAGALGVVLQIRSPEGRQESRALVQAAARMRSAGGTPVWVSGGGAPAWRFYSGDRSPIERAVTNEPGGMGAGRIGRDVLVGEWYASIPERIVSVVDDTAALSRPSAWSEREAARLRARAQPCALVFLSHGQPGEAGALLASVVRLGGRVVESRREPGAELHRVCFETSAPNPPR